MKFIIHRDFLLSCTPSQNWRQILCEIDDDDELELGSQAQTVDFWDPALLLHWLGV